jgi:hypothetical protein
MDTLSRLMFKIIAEIRKIAQAKIDPFTIGGKLNLGTPNAVGQPSAARGGTANGGRGAEPPLPTPPGPGYLLTSGPDGARVWLQLIAGSGISITVNETTGAITIGNATLLDTLSFGGDDLTFGGAFLGFGES